jgi:hypothetical protein
MSTRNGTRRPPRTHAADMQRSPAQALSQADEMQKAANEVEELFRQVRASARPAGRARASRAVMAY